MQRLSFVVFLAALLLVGCSKDSPPVPHGAASNDEPGLGKREPSHDPTPNFKPSFSPSPTENERANDALAAKFGAQRRSSNTMPPCLRR